MKLLKICLVFLIIAGLSSCEVQDIYNVNDIVDGTPSNADTVLPHKFKKYEASDSLRAIHSEENLLPEYKR
ncbi:MAG: hypothetical protein ABI237_19265 [Ginsengibacter sp.]